MLYLWVWSAYYLMLTCKVINVNKNNIARGYINFLIESVKDTRKYDSRYNRTNWRSIFDIYTDENQRVLRMRLTLGSQRAYFSSTISRSQWENSCCLNTCRRSPTDEPFLLLWTIYCELRKKINYSRSSKTKTNIFRNYSVIYRKIISIRKKPEIGQQFL